MVLRELKEGGEIKPTSYQESDNGIYEVKMSDGEIVIVDFSLEYFEEQRNKKDIFAQAKRNYEPSTYAKGGEIDEDTWTDNEMQDLLEDIGYEVDDNNLGELAINEGFYWDSDNNIWKNKNQSFAKGGSTYAEVEK